MPTDPYTHAITTLRDLGGQRVWSLMVSLFGDLAQSEGDVIPGPVLSAIMSTMAIRPEAGRVALHRLRNDGWIISRKEGRISHHSLSPLGRLESAAASPRIYATPDALPRQWQALITRDDDEATQADLIRRGFTMLQPRLYVGASDAPAPPDALRLHGTHVPDWLRDQLAPHHLADEYAALSEGLAAIRTTLPEAAALSPLQIAALRCLIVHNWRRLALKHPPLPLPLISDDSPSLICRAAVSQLLSRYSRPALGDIAVL